MLESFEHDGFRFYAKDKASFHRGDFYVSVTTVLDILNEAWIKAWFKKHTAEHIDNVLKQAGDAGNALHKAVEEDLLGRPYTISPELMPAMDNWHVLKAKHSIVGKEMELVVFNNEWGYAGRVDAVVEFEGRPVVMDLKTGKYSIKTGYQLAAYKYALELMGKYKDLGMVGVHVPRGGEEAKTFVYQRYDYCFTVFCAAWTAWRGVNFNKLKGMGWKKLKDEVQIFKVGSGQ